MSWRAESYQLVAFHSSNEVEDAYQVWLALFQVSPDNYQRHPDPAFKSTMASGSLFGYSWQIQCSPGRVDLQLTEPPIDDQYPFPEIKSEAAAVEILRQQLLKPLVHQVGVLRLGLVCQFFNDFETHQGVNGEFGRVTGIAIDSANAMDVSFGLNVRKELNDLSVTLNRICRWQGLEKQAMNVQMHVPTHDPLRVPPQEFVPDVVQPTLMFSLDINTQVKQSAFDPHVAEVVCNRMLDEVAVLKGGGYVKLISD